MGRTAYLCRRVVLRATWHGRRLGLQRLAHAPQELGRSLLLDRNETAELQARQLDAAEAPHGLESEVGKKVAREDRSVDEEPLLGRLALGVPVAEGLDRLPAPLAHIRDRSEEERLHDPLSR